MRQSISGFTLIELSIVLVIIGLIVGGILVGQDLINISAMQAQISQIQKYNTAVNTFRQKYGYLPGDIPAQTASALGFASRSGAAGDGDGNGLIEGIGALGYITGKGETVYFWNDLGVAGLIDGSFSADSSGSISVDSSTGMDAYLPAGKIRHNSILVWSGGYGMDEGNGVGTGGGSAVGNVTDGYNYFALTQIVYMGGGGGYNFSYSNASIAGLTPIEALEIDSKIDDGLPQSGTVTAIAPGMCFDNGAVGWASNFSINTVGDCQGGIITSGPSATDQSGTPSSATTCYDNDGQPNSARKYSTGNLSAATNFNCYLSFRFQ